MDCNTRNWFRAVLYLIIKRVNYYYYIMYVCTYPVCCRLQYWYAHTRARIDGWKRPTVDHAFPPIIMNHDGFLLQHDAIHFTPVLDGEAWWASWEGPCLPGPFVQSPP
jgi:hypothetical protein